MSPHKKIYTKAFGYTPADHVCCEVCGAPAVDIHAIIPDGMGGRPLKDTHRIENLIALDRKHHLDYGDKKHFKSWLFTVHKHTMESHGVKFDKQWIGEQIEKFNVYSLSDIR